MTTLVVCSGGLDSVVLAHKLASHGDVRLISFDYGQRHAKELVYAVECAHRLNARYSTVDLTPVGRLLSGSALTDPTVPVPDGRYDDPSMRSTVVPNRNAIMLSVAVGVADAEGIDTVAFGAHGGDHPVYADCRPDFVTAAHQAALLATERRVGIVAPFLRLTKAEIVGIGRALRVPFEKTWSCYKGGDAHCGTCGTCVERKEAFALAGVPDPTAYAA